MRTYAAVMTGKGAGAIATIQVCGKSPKSIIEKFFKPKGELHSGKIYTGKIIDRDKIIDQITIGCIDKDNFTINCHGNPLIVAEICHILEREGVELVSATELITKKETNANTIALEARLILPQVKTIEGTQIILNQISAGLTTFAKDLLESEGKQINDEAKKIIEASQTAKLIIYGCKIVLTGPANSGKSTLMNRLAGRENAIVADIKGTTRDWVSAECKIGALAVELIDTAGLEDTPGNDIDKAAQKAAFEIINQADLILIVLDNNETVEQINRRLIKSISGNKYLTVINKTDLPSSLDITKLPEKLISNFVQISAKTGAGISNLTAKICEISGVKNFEFNQPICFTSRQERLLKQLTEIKAKQAAKAIITELLSGSVNV